MAPKEGTYTCIPRTFRMHTHTYIYILYAYLGVVEKKIRDQFILQDEKENELFQRCTDNNDRSAEDDEEIATERERKYVVYALITCCREYHDCKKKKARKIGICM